MFALVVSLAVAAALGCLLIMMSFVAMFSLRHVVRSMDIFMSSISLTLLGNSSVVILMPCLMFLIDSTWDTLTCKMYIWAVMALRLNSIVSFVGISIERMLLIRRPGKYRYRATLALCLGVMIMWLVAMFLAMIPVLGWSHFQYQAGNALVAGNETSVLREQCTLFLHELHRGLGIGVMVLEFSSMLTSIVCLSDIYCHLRYLTKRTLFSSESRGAVAVGRNLYADMNLNDANSPTHNGKIGHTNPAFKSTTSMNKTNDFIYPTLTNGKEESNSLGTDVSSGLPLATVQGSVHFTAALDSCKLVIAALAVMILLDHIPYTILTFYGIVRELDTNVGHVTMMWLLSFESIFVAAGLWTFNARYRKAHVRIFKCWCHEDFFLREDDHIIADVHDAKYSTPPDYSSHRTRYHDTSKTVHKTIQRDRAHNSESRDGNSNDVMASNSTLSNGNQSNDNDASRNIINSSQESFENTGDTDVPSTSGMLTLTGVQVLGDTDMRTSVKDTSSDDGDTDSYLSLKRFVGESSEELDTPLSWSANNRASRKNGVLREHANDVDVGDEYEILQNTERNCNHTTQAEILPNDTQDISPTESSSKYKNNSCNSEKPDITNNSKRIPGQDPVPEVSRTTALNEQDSVPETIVHQVSSRALDPHSATLAAAQQSSAESTDSHTPAYTLDDIEEVLENDANEPESVEDVSSSDRVSTRQDRSIIKTENENTNNSNHIGASDKELLGVEGSPTSNLLVENASMIGYAFDNIGMEHHIHDIEEDVDDFDEVFRFKHDDTLWVSLADELEQAQRTEQVKGPAISSGHVNSGALAETTVFRKVEFDSQIARKFQEPSLARHIEGENDLTPGNPVFVSRGSFKQSDACGNLFEATCGDAQLNTVYEHFDTSEGHVEAVVETRGRGKVLGTFPGVKSSE